MPPKPKGKGTEKTVKENVAHVLTRRNIVERPHFSIANANLPVLNVKEGGYHQVCGEDAPVTGDVPAKSTGSVLVDQFIGQIGCYGTNPRRWKEQRHTYRAQFDKARQCFRGRVDAMKAYPAATPDEIKEREQHAFAIHTAYTLGRDCLRKIADVPGAEDVYRESAHEYIRDASVADKSIEESLVSDKDRQMYSIIVANPFLGRIYNETYGLTPEQFAIYHAFLRYSAINASKVSNVSGYGKRIIDDYATTFLPATATEGGGGAVAATGGAGTSVAAIPITPAGGVNVGLAGLSINGPSRINRKKTQKQTQKQKKGEGKGTSTAAAANNFNALLNAAAAEVEATTPKEINIIKELDLPISFNLLTVDELYRPSLSVTPDILTDGKTDYNKLQTLIATARTALIKLPADTPETPEVSKELLLTKILPALYASTEVNILVMKQSFIAKHWKPFLNTYSRYFDTVTEALKILVTLLEAFSQVVTVALSKTHPLLYKDFVTLSTYIVRRIREIERLFHQHNEFLSWSSFWPQLELIDIDPMIEEMLSKIKRKK